MKYSNLVNNMDKVITTYCKANGIEGEVKTKIIAVRHPAEEKNLVTYNTTIFDIEWECDKMSDKTTLVLDERDGSVHILSDMQSGLADKMPLEEYDWTDLTAFVCDDDCEG